MVNRSRRGSSGKALSFTPELKKTVKSAGNPLDSTTPESEEIRFRRKHSDLSRRLENELSFTKDEIESLIVIYYKFAITNKNPEQGMTKLQFKELLYYVLCIPNPDEVAYALDTLPSWYISLESWVRAMNVLLRGSFEEQIKHCFKVYEKYGQGQITQNRMRVLLAGCLPGEENQEETIKDLVEVILNKIDIDRDGVINYSDFKESVTRKPTRLAAKSFLASFTQYIGKL